MPTYQYACTACDHAFEQFQSFSDDALTECPECHGRLRKVFNAVGVVFKGSGFYRTDSRAGTGERSGGDGKDAGSATKSESPATGTSTGGGAAKSDGGAISAPSKPATSGSSGRAEPAA